jgi:transcriptional regulator with XRE-family HTH domain
MITAIRDVRRARGLTLDEVARRCVPPTSPQTIGRLETGTRTVSLPWLRRIAAALGVEPGDLVRMPDRGDLPVAALLDARGAHAPRRALALTPPAPAPGLVGVQVAAGVGDYRAGDELWLERLSPDRFAEALGRDVLVPVPAGRYRFGRLLAAADREVTFVPLPGTAPERASPAWLARAVRLVRPL